MSNMLDSRPKTDKDLQAKIRGAFDAANQAILKGGISALICLGTPIALHAVFAGVPLFDRFESVISSVLFVMGALGGVQLGLGLFMRGIAPSGWTKIKPNRETQERLEFLASKYPEVNYVLQEWKNSEVGFLDGDLPLLEKFVKETSPAISGKHPSITYNTEDGRQLKELSWRIKPAKNKYID